eukprot:COSAG05_NODE_3396_length_2087_cov_5.121683_2_plen_63_part_00
MGRGPGDLYLDELKEICNRFNCKGGCKHGDSCSREHVCHACEGEHPLVKCKEIKFGYKPTKP